MCLDSVFSITYSHSYDKIGYGMIFMWKHILAIIAVILILKYSILLIKRAILISSVKKACKHNGLEFKKRKNLFKSVFVRDGKKHVLLVYPVTYEVTRVEGNKVVPAYNGDEIWKNCIFSNKSYFLDNIERFAE